MTNNLSKLSYIVDYKLYILKIFFTSLLLFPGYAWSQPAIPCGHSHNDYLKKRPLFEAVELGFGSIEIDVCLDKNNQVKVAHNPWMLGAKKTIEEMYLDPIKKMIGEKDPGFTYTAEAPLTLMIDIKTGGDTTYCYLKTILEKYSYITQYKAGNIFFAAPVKICISGHRPSLGNNGIEYARLDASLQKVWDARAPIPWVERASAPYAGFLNNSIIDIYNKNKVYAGSESINNLQANQIGVRFYAAPNNKKVWKFLLDIGLQWINVDKLKKFSDFYHGYKKENR